MPSQSELPHLPVGTKVRIIHASSPDPHRFNIGDIVTITGQFERIGHRPDDFRIRAKCRSASFVIRPEDFVVLGARPAPVNIVTMDNTGVTVTAETKCECCSSIIEDGEETQDTNDGIVCQDCYEDNYYTCEQCGDIHHSDDSVSPGESGNIYCSERCANRDGWHECADCNDWTNETYYNDHNNIICENCLDNYYSCEDCGDAVHSDNVRSNDNGYYCEDCFDGRDSSSDLIHDYSYKPREYIYTKMPTENTMYLGIELEVETSGKVSEKAELVTAWLQEHRVSELVYLKEDSSLNNGFEVVFHPITLKALKEVFPIKDFLAYMVSIGLESHKKTSCGLHVHLTKKEMNEGHIYNGKVFFHLCKSYIKAFSKRDSFNYCKFDESMPSAWNDQPNGRYSAFNSCASSSTVEIRVFKGTLGYKRFMASMEFSDAFGEFIKTNVLVKYATSGDTWMLFIKYVRENRYTGLIEYLEGKNLIA